MKAKPEKIGMDLQTSKLELVKMIVNIDNQTIINKLLDFLKSEKKNFWFELSEKDRQEIDAGIKQLDSGERIPLDVFLERLDNPK